MIEATDLTKRFGRQLAVDGLSFRLAPGTVTGFLGPNGAGKSTTMRLMLELERGGGRTTFDGWTYRRLPGALRVVGTLLEARAFHPGRSARNHLRMLAAAGGIGRGRVDEVLGLVGLESVADAKPRTFSLGMAQRLGLAGALLGDPAVLLLDEPANGLDPEGMVWLRRLLSAFAADGGTAFVSSHQLADMAHLADHLVVLGRGRLVADCPTDDFVSRFCRTDVVVRTPEAQRLQDLLLREGATVRVEPDGALVVSGPDMARVASLAQGAGLLLHELTRRSGTLEDAFLEATAGEGAYSSTASGRGLR